MSIHSPRAVLRGAGSRHPVDAPTSRRPPTTTPTDLDDGRRRARLGRRARASTSGAFFARAHIVGTNLMGFRTLHYVSGKPVVTVETMRHHHHHHRARVDDDDERPIDRPTERMPSRTSRTNFRRRLNATFGSDAPCVKPGVTAGQLHEKLKSFQLCAYCDRGLRLTRPVGTVPQLARGGIRDGPTGLFYDDADGREVSYEDAVRAEAAERTRAEPEDETRDEEADATRAEPDEALVDETALTATRCEEVSLLERALRFWTRGGNVARGVARAVSGAERLERERLREHVEALEDARVLVETERDALRDERDALRDERDALRDERDALRGERDALRDERDALRGERESLCAERDESRARNDEVRARNDELRVQSDEFRGFIDSMYHVVAGVQQSLKATADDE